MYIVRTEVKQSPIQGEGYFSMEAIPVGTLIYYHSEEDMRYSKLEFDKLNDDQQRHLLEYGVEDEFGNWIETKSGPFTNHSCNANILPLYIDGIYTDIVVRDIEAGEEITVDYGLFFSSQRWSMECNCKSERCRNKIGFGISKGIEPELFWEERVKNATQKIHDVRQPIFDVEDKFAELLKKALESKKSPLLSKQIKFSLISAE